MGRQISAGWENKLFSSASISLARWRWRLLHYFKQVVNLSATCFHVELEQFSACFRVARVCQRELAFFVRTTSLSREFRNGDKIVIAVNTLYFKNLTVNSNNSVDPKRIWTIFGRNTARGFYTLLLCTFTYYLTVQLGTSLCCHGNWFEEARSPGTHLLRQFLRWLWTSFSSQMKNFSRWPHQSTFKMIALCSCDYHDVTLLTCCQPTLKHGKIKLK